MGRAEDPRRRVAARIREPSARRPSPGRMTRTSRRSLGITIGALYALTAVLTVAFTPHHVRPLFEGFTPPPPYQWVDPPGEFKAGHASPQPKTSAFPLLPARA